MVKNILILYVLFLYTSNGMAQVEHRLEDNSQLTKFVVEASDTFRTMPVNSDVRIGELQNGKSKCSFNKDRWGTLVISLTRITESNILYATELFRIADSLAQTDDYMNIIFAHELYSFGCAFLANVEGNLKEQGKDFAHITKLMQDAFYIDTKYCGRYTVLLFTGTERAYFTSEVIEEMRKLLEHPFLTQDDAEFMFKSKKPTVFNDTTGYQFHLQKFKSHDTTVDESFVRRSYGLLEILKRKGISIKEYNDELKHKSDSIFKERIVGKPIYLDRIYGAVGRAHIKELAPLMEELYKDSRLKNYSSFAECILARLQYMDYEERVISRLSKQIREKPIVDSYYDIFNDLAYIHTQKSYAAIAPLLLREELIRAGIDGMYSISIGIECLLLLNKEIANLPWEYSVNGGDKYISEEYFEKNPYPQELLMKMYKWMNDNKGSYKLIRD